MRQDEDVGPWVVYRVVVLGRHGKDLAANVVCRQSRWDALERDRPGLHALVRSGIANEAEAERVAREAPGGTAGRAPRLKARA